MPTLDDLPSEWVDPATVECLRELSGGRIDAAVVLGSGWGQVADSIGRCLERVPYAQIPGFASSRVIGHEGVVMVIEHQDSNVLVLSGRVHHYEGYSATEVVRGVRAAVLAGAQSVILTNAAGSVNPQLKAGQLVVLSDHINLLGVSPLAGPIPSGLNRFLSMTDCYDAAWRKRLLALAPDLPSGVYAAMPGPQYETLAEVRMLRTIGADLVGMSTVLEAIAAHHLGARVMGVSLAANVAGGTGDEAFDGDSVVAVGGQSLDRLGAVIRLCLDSAR